jgi:hypothetical protein
MPEVSQWQLAGDWFDVCRCTIPCPCTFAQAPSDGTCEGVLAWHIKKGSFGDVQLDDLTVLAIAQFEGNIWAGETKATMALFMDERADDRQREALNVIFGGQAGGWPADFATNVGEVLGLEYVPITFEIADDLAHWSAEIPGKVNARAEALTGPTTGPGERVQVHNAPGAEVGPGQVATWGVATADRVDAFGMKWEWDGRSSKHFPFEWEGP